MVSRRSIVMLLIVGFVQLADRAAAQTNEHDILHGIKTVTVMAQAATEVDKACGLDMEAAKAAATKALLDGGIRVVSEKEASEAGLGIRFTTLHFATAAVCVSNVKVDISARAFATFAFNEEPVRAWIMLEEQGTLISSPRADHPSRTTQKITDMTEILASHIRLANQKQ